VAVRRHHYERAFESYLTRRRLAYIAFEEARDALLASPARLRTGCDDAGGALKSFDFVLYTPNGNLLLDVKGRRVSGGRLESWATQDDVSSLLTWERLFGEGFRAGLVFVYWRDAEMHSALFEETFEHDGRWYAVRLALIGEYAQRMRVRSPKWRTVDLLTPDFDAIARPLDPEWSSDPLQAR